MFRIYMIATIVLTLTLSSPSLTLAAHWSGKGSIANEPKRRIRYEIESHGDGNKVTFELHVAQNITWFKSFDGYIVGADKSLTKQFRIETKDGVKKASIDIPKGMLGGQLQLEVWYGHGIFPPTAEYKGVHDASQYLGKTVKIFIDED